MLEHAIAERRDEILRAKLCCSASSARLCHSGVRSDIPGVVRELAMMLGMPVLRDVEPRRDPDAVVFVDVVEKLREPRRAPRLPRKAAVQARPTSSSAQSSPSA
jgi:hypothetical protein